MAKYFINIRKNPYYIPEDENEIKHVDAVLKFLSIMSGSEKALEKFMSIGEREVKNMSDEVIWTLPAFKEMDDGYSSFCR